MAIRQLKGMKPFETVKQEIERSVTASGLSASLIHSTTHRTEDGKVSFMVFEKFFYRTSNRASLSVLIVDSEPYVYVDIIATGASQGMIFRFSWGADDAFLRSAVDPLLKMGFTDA